MKKYGAVDEEFAMNLVTWSEVIRKTFFDGGVDEVISTRRLDHIVKALPSLVTRCSPLNCVSLVLMKIRRHHS